jgi:coenzyme F420-reducing hydrogenase delta subunit
MAPRKVILLTCNWNAYSGLETAGAQRRAYPAGVYPLKATCLGQVDPGIILKAFENGAEGVLMLGCPPDQCHYEFGNRRAEEVYAQAKELVKVLGYSDSQLQLDWVAAGEGQDLVNKVRDFVAGLNGARRRR